MYMYSKKNYIQTLYESLTETYYYVEPKEKHNKKIKPYVLKTSISNNEV